MSKLVLLKGTAAITKSIVSIQTRGKKLDADIQLTGVSIMAHIDEHNTIDLANNLLKALPKSTRTNTLIAWVEAHGKATYDLKSKAFVFDKAKKTQLELAEAKPWYSYLPEPAYKPLDFFAEAGKFIAKYEKRLSEIAEEKKKNPNYSTEDKCNTAALLAFKAMIAKAQAPVAAANA